MIELIDRKKAIKRESEIREEAFKVASSFDTLPGYCDEKPCVLWRAYSRITQLKDNEQCVFIDGMPAKKLTDFEISPGEFVVGDICGKNVSGASMKDDVLEVTFADGVKEDYVNCGDYFKFKTSNTTLNTKFQSGGKN